MSERVGAAVARTRALVGLVFSVGFALLFVVVTVRLARGGVGLEAVVAAAFTVALAWQSWRCYWRLRLGTFTGGRPRRPAAADRSA